MRSPLQGMKITDAPTIFPENVAAMIEDHFKQLQSKLRHYCGDDYKENFAVVMLTFYGERAPTDDAICVKDAMSLSTHDLESMLPAVSQVVMGVAVDFDQKMRREHDINLS